MRNGISEGGERSLSAVVCSNRDRRGEANWCLSGPGERKPWDVGESYTYCGVYPEIGVRGGLRKANCWNCC